MKKINQLFHSPTKENKQKKNWLINVRLINKRIGRVIKGKIMGLAPTRDKMDVDGIKTKAMIQHYLRLDRSNEPPPIVPQH